MENNLEEIVKKLTLEEKASLCSGLNHWETKPVERLGIPSIMMADGPHGLRKQEQDPDHIALSGSVPATCYPAASALACSWDRDLVQQVGSHLGKECQAQNIDIILGPGTNIKRSPLCGRNFEYFSEDPYLSSEMAASHVRGVQGEGIGTSLKHFAANNQEFRRLITDTLIDERTLREIYLASFEGVVKKAQPWTVMCAYNRINGSFCSENSRLLTKILRDEWGFEGFVVSDWGAVNDRVEGVKAGLELEMPACEGDRDKLIVKAVQSGELDEKVLDKVVLRFLGIIKKAVENRKEGVTFDEKEHHAFARKTAAQCMVLLKNEGDTLPLEKIDSLAVIGGFATYPRYQGGGSSHVNPTTIDLPLEEIKKIAGERKMTVEYQEGYPVDRIVDRYSHRRFNSVSDEPDADMIEAACETAKKADAAVIFTGLPEPYESEGYDRKHISIPAGHEELIKAVASVQPNTIVVLSNGSPIEMPWLSSVKAVVEGYLGGQAFGGAIADILFGEVSPSGKLAETYPLRVEDNPSYLFFPGDGTMVDYREGLYVGYRYYDAAARETLFPFGFGLSYTDFSYESMETDKKVISDKDTLQVRVKVRNSGKRAGKETVQLYVRPKNAPVQRPDKELKGFEKITLSSGETGEAVFSLDKRAFAYYDPEIADWYVANGEYEILAGSSSKSLHLAETVTLKSENRKPLVYTRNSSVQEVYDNKKGRVLLDEVFDEMEAKGGMKKQFALTLFRELPLRSIHLFAGKKMYEEQVAELLRKINS